MFGHLSNRHAREVCTFLGRASVPQQKQLCSLVLVVVLLLLLLLLLLLTVYSP